VLGVLVDAVELDEAADMIVAAAHAGHPMSVAPVAVHPVVMAVHHRKYRAQLNRVDLVVADGQPVRWALNLLYRARLRDRVYGPELMRVLCKRAADAGMPVYLYGSWPATVTALHDALARDYPGLRIAGAEPARMIAMDRAEQTALTARIRASGARLVFVGLGCPRQEEFVWALRDLVDAPLVAVGAAFDYNAGLLDEPPAWMMRAGLQWLHRLRSDPRRLWRRYVVCNPVYALGVLAQLARVWRPRADLPVPQRALVPG
jgi:N-acetylglucosaminyldiphosphoundecaprenol N-acetyl-beta-D-mannosaminyltransferase